MPLAEVLTTKPIRCSVTPVVVGAVVVADVADAADVAVVAVDGAVAVETVGEVKVVVEPLEVAILVADDGGSVDAVGDVDAVDAVDAVVVVEAVDFVGAVVSKRSQPAARRHMSETARMMLMSWTTIRVGLNGLKRDMISTSFPECRRPGTGLAR